MWVCRSGKNGEYYHYLKDEQYLYFPWEGYDFNLRGCDKNYLRKQIELKNGKNNKTSLSNWMGQVVVFVDKIQLGDLVIIPSKKSHSFTLVRVVGDYEFIDGNMSLFHRRKVEIIKENIPKDVFSSGSQYLLRAYRTIFRVRDENKIIQEITKAYGEL